MSVPVGAAGVRGLPRAYLAGGGAAARTGVSSSPAYNVKLDSKQNQDKLYDLLPGMELTPLKISKTPSQASPA